MKWICTLASILLLVLALLNTDNKTLVAIFLVGDLNMIAAGAILHKLEKMK